MFQNKRSKVLIISPSGNFYGSEQVLLDYLKTTKLTANVMAPSGSMFMEILLASGLRHKILPYNSRHLPIFYAKVFTWLLTGRYNYVYLNEAGHTKYIQLLSRFFRSKNFLIHVRIREDAQASRWHHLRKNVQIITISRYIHDLLPMASILLYDSYMFSNEGNKPSINKIAEPLRVGVIGRLSSTKGVFELLELLKLTASKKAGKFHFYLFGEEGSDIKGTSVLGEILSYPFVSMMGFVKDKQKMYDQVDLILHLSKTEPLGRIFFEAIEENKPLVGFDAAGIGEIGHMAGLTELLVDPQVKDSAVALYEKMEMARTNYLEFARKVADSKPMASEIFNIVKYSGTLDKFMQS